MNYLVLVKIAFFYLFEKLLVIYEIVRRAVLFSRSFISCRIGRKKLIFIRFGEKIIYYGVLKSMSEEEIDKKLDSISFPKLFFAQLFWLY